MLIILFLIVVSLVLFIYFKKYMDIVDIFFMFPFVIYALCCLAVVFYGYAAGYGKRESFDIETTLVFIGLITPSLVVYTIIKLLIDTFQNFKVWKICNAVFLCIFIYFYLVIFGAIQKPILLPKWIAFFIAYRMSFVYLSIALIVYTIIKLLIDTFQNFKVWKICNAVFLCILIYCLYTRLENIKTGYIFSTFLCCKDDKYISCEKLVNE